MPARDIAATEAEIHQIWTEILPAAPQTVDDDFFDLGGQSLHLVLFLQQIYERHGVDLPVAELFTREFSVRRTAQAVHRLLGAPGAGGAEAVDVGDDLLDRLAALPPEEADALLAELRQRS